MLPETKAQQWDAIVAHYQTLGQYNRGSEMAFLVQHIVSSGAAARLFAFTSHATLKLGIYELMTTNQEMLWISFIPEKGLFSFDYYANDDRRTQPEFSRLYPEEIVTQKFDQCIRWLRW
ncbi:hypothetical protein [Hymenobacter guriensis]|uniref:Uncharacterized protein n=1 Tax=Hymenobacter guriensis TaxID=2793065 RepID=A0ABS0L006_9BACT|nr:hypothetical protein [Hymenobacter guriensis]MBG8552779.1 hypothetical protein [Hymenobacter guriensis]